MAKALQSDKNLIYSLPTSGGKTLVAELLMIREVVCRRKDCLFVLPYVSIVQEKVQSFSYLSFALDFAISEYAGDHGVFPPQIKKSRSTIYIATMEKAQGIINYFIEFGRLSEIGNCHVNVVFCYLCFCFRLLFHFYQVCLWWTRFTWSAKAWEELRWKFYFVNWWCPPSVPELWLWAQR